MRGPNTPEKLQRPYLNPLVRRAGEATTPPWAPTRIPLADASLYFVWFVLPRQTGVSFLGGLRFTNPPIREAFTADAFQHFGGTGGVIEAEFDAMIPLKVRLCGVALQMGFANMMERAV